MTITHATQIPLPHDFDNNVLDYAESLGHGEFHVKMDPATGLRAIVAIHSTAHGPAMGGCRCIEYDNVGFALYDALRLAQGMSYKAAISDLPYGGGKAVLIKPKQIHDREAYFAAFGRFVNDLGGRYITAMDMDVIARHTPYVTSNSLPDGSITDPSGFTAIGVQRGIEAAVKFKLGRDTLEGVHVAIQGTGHVGFLLAKQLHAAGAKLTIADVDELALQRCLTEVNAQVVAPDEIYGVECDVYAPCALGAVINHVTLPLLKAPIVAGSANNQLEEPLYGRFLQEKGILYAPDYVISAGGLIHAVGQYEHTIGSSMKIDVDAKINGIYDTLISIFERAERENLATGDVADAMAAQRLKRDDSLAKAVGY
jgi:leucine dehydrogenase